LTFEAPRKCQNVKMAGCRDAGMAEPFHDFIFTAGNQQAHSAGVFLLHVADFFIGTVMEGWRH